MTLTWKGNEKGLREIENKGYIMKINGDITILADKDGARIEIRDRDASVLFVEINLSSQQFCQALGRLAHVKCNLNVSGLNKVGKKHENKTFEFELPKNMELWGTDKKIIADYAETITPEGWKNDRYFNSRDSFFTKDGKDWARCTIRRWV